MTSRLLALVLTAVLVWHTVVIPPGGYAPAKRPRRRSSDGAERARETQRGRRSGTTRAANEWPEEGACRPVDDLDWPEFIDLE